MKIRSRIITGIVFSLLLACNSQKAAKSATASDPALKLNGTWELNYISGPRIAFGGLYPDKKPQITFNLPSTEATGNSSCNGFGCKFTINASQIVFGDPIGTVMACEGEGEQTFYKTLKLVNQFNVADSILTLSNNETPLMRFFKK